jgi:hypothetical protein
MNKLEHTVSLTAIVAPIVTYGGLTGRFDIWALDVVAVRAISGEAAL